MGCLLALSAGGRSQPAMRSMREICIYALIDPRDGAVRYVGKANDAYKRLKGHLREARRRKTPVYAWIRKLQGLELSPRIEILRVCDASNWKEAEIEEIAKHALGGRLLNLAKGGDEPFCSTEIRARNGAANAKAIHSDPQRKRFWYLMRALGESLKRGYVSEVTKAKMRQRMDVFGRFMQYL